MDNCCEVSEAEMAVIEGIVFLEQGDVSIIVIEGIDQENIVKEQHAVKLVVLVKENGVIY